MIRYLGGWAGEAGWSHILASHTRGLRLRKPFQPARQPSGSVK